MMITAMRFIAEARKLVGTRFRHTGRARNIYDGCDCIGLPIAAARNAGLGTEELFGLSGNPEYQKDVLRARATSESIELLLMGRYAATASPKPTAAANSLARRVRSPLPGDLLVFRLTAAVEPEHIAIYTDTATFIHADAIGGKVVETVMGQPWVRQLHSCWALPGVARV